MSDSDHLGPPSAAPPERMLTFRSGGWLLLIVVIVVVAIPAARIAYLWPQLTGAQHAQGDGHTLESYGFELEPLLVSRDDLRPIGRELPRDALPALDVDRAPPAARPLPAADLPPDNRLDGIRKMTSDTPVIGVVLNGEARAYPLWILNWHELANDTLGGLPIVVTYNGVCDSSAVFERVIGGRERRFGFSGLLYNGNLVFYDRRDPDHYETSDHPETGDNDAAAAPAAESLWSQLQMRAISGPAAADGLTLRLVPFERTTWAEWRTRYPDTTLLRADPVRRRLYRREPYLTYFADERLKFHVKPSPPPGRRLKTPMLAWRTGPDASWTVIEAASPEAAEAPREAERLYALWFAWYAHHGHVNSSGMELP